MRNYLLASLIAVLAQAGVTLAGPPTPSERPLNDETFRYWLDFIRPRPEELAFQDIPWRTTFLDAVVEAQKVDRPILLWAMNGHPLACT